jgi:hypothetical protein
MEFWGSIDVNGYNNREDISHVIFSYMVLKCLDLVLEIVNVLQDLSVFGHVRLNSKLIILVQYVKGDTIFS